MRQVGLVVRVVAGSAALVRLARVRRRHRPVTPATTATSDGGPAISVVIPARNEAGRIGPLLGAVVGAPGVSEVLVVDDQSTDDTAAVARRLGAIVVDGQPRPRGWAGKAWALQQGLGAAQGEWIVTLDADTRPDPQLPAAVVARARTDALDVVTLAGRFECPTPGLRWLHPALLTTLVYRGAPPGAVDAGPVHRRMGNGQCMAFPQATLAGAGGFATVAAHTVEDVALVRGLAVAGFAVEFLDASALLRVRMYESFADAWTGWGRSLSLPGVDPWLRRALDLVVVAVAQAAPLPRLLARRGDVLDVVLLIARIGTLIGTARAYDRRGPTYWLSPLADPLAIVALARGLVTRRQRWRGRTYG
ncbi:MAG: glycosyltransferase [Ilumatobacteraceae bacterium]